MSIFNSKIFPGLHLRPLLKGEGRGEEGKKGGRTASWLLGLDASQHMYGSNNWQFDQELK